MRFIKPLFLCISGFLLCIPLVNAAEVNLTWLEPEKFQDVEAGGVAGQKQYQQQVLDELGRHIQAAADKYLTEDYTLDMTVTDMDLAGEVRYFFTRFPGGVRYVDDLYFPGIEFVYELKDGNDMVKKQGQENIRDLGFRFSGLRMVEDAPLGYEKRMIDEWFRDTFSES